MFNRLLFVFIISSISFLVNAYESPQLSKDTITSYKQIAKKWGKIAEKYPDLGKQMRGLDLTDSDKAFEYLSNSEAKSSLNKALDGSQFESIIQVLVFSKRFLAIQYFIEFEISQEGVNLVEMVKVLEANIERMKAGGTSMQTINKMQVQLAQHKKRAESIQYMLGLLSPQDKTFVKENIDWLKSIK